MVHSLTNTLTRNSSFLKYYVYFASLVSLVRAYIGHLLGFKRYQKLITDDKVESIFDRNETKTCKLNIVIVGGGLGGLAAAYCLGRAGHKVTLLEAARTLGEVGAGIQLGPNVSRLLIRWGLKDKLDALGVRPKGINFRRFDTGECVGLDFFGETMEKEYGMPYYHIHRADLHRMLCDLAMPYTTIRLNSRVVSVSPDLPSPHVVTQCGEVIYGDVIIGADGVRSAVRTCISEGSDDPAPTGDAVYRAVISTEHFLNDPDLKPFVDHPECTIWMGPGMHVVGYCLRGKKEYNLVMVHKDTASTESWTAPGDVTEMYKLYEGWDPRLRKIQALVKSVLLFRMMERLPLKTWVNCSGRVALIGDACHPMLPYRAQGAAMAIEDAAVLGNIFSRITSRSQIPAFLQGYQSMRYGRATDTQLTSLSLQKVFHHHDGLEQQARDAAMREAMALTMKEGCSERLSGSEDRRNPNAWVDKKNKDMLLGYDADFAANEWWLEYSTECV